jgi:hypothetical protein
MSMTQAPAGGYSIGWTISRALEITRRNAKVLAPLAVFLGFLPQLGAQLTAPTTDGLDGGRTGLYVLLTLLSAVAALVLQVAVVHCAVAALRERTATMAECLNTSLRLFWPVLAVGILIAIGVALGTLLFIVPGIMLAVRWTIAVPVRVAEGPGIASALGRSAVLTRNHRWAIFGTFVVMWIATLVIMMVVSIIGTLAFLVTGPAGIRVGIGAMTAMVVAVFQTVFTVALGVIYHELKVAKEGGDVDQVAEVFA